MTRSHFVHVLVLQLLAEAAQKSKGHTCNDSPQYVASIACTAAEWADAVGKYAPFDDDNVDPRLKPKPHP